MKKSEIVKLLKVSDLFQLCRLYKIKTGRKQVMVEMLLSKLKNIPKHVILEATRQRGGGPEETKKLLKLFPDKFPQAYAVPVHVPVQPILNKNWFNIEEINKEINEIKDKLRSFNANVLVWNRSRSWLSTSVPNKNDELIKEETSVPDKYDELIKEETRIQETISDFVEKIPDEDVQMVALSHGIMMDPLQEWQKGGAGGAVSSPVDAPANYRQKTHSQLYLQNILQSNIVPIFRKDTETMEHAAFLEMMKTNNINTREFSFECNYYDSYCNELYSPKRKPQESKVGSIIFDEHPYKNIYFEKTINERHDLFAYAEHSVNPCIQFKFTEPIDKKHIISVKKQTVTELIASLNEIYDANKYEKSLQSEAFFVYLKHEMLLHPMQVFFSFRSFIENVIKSKNNPTLTENKNYSTVTKSENNQTIQLKRDIVRFVQFDYGLCWLCAALNMLYLAQRKYVIIFNNTDFESVWEKTKKTLHILDVAKYHFYKKWEMQIPNDQREFKKVYNAGGSHNFIWKMIKNSQAVDYRTKYLIQANKGTKLNISSFSKLNFFNFRTKKDSYFHVVGAVKKKDGIHIYDSQNVTSLTLDEYLSNVGTTHDDWEYQIIPITLEKKDSIKEQNQQKTTSHVVSSTPKVKQDGVKIFKKEMSTILLELLLKQDGDK